MRRVALLAVLTGCRGGLSEPPPELRIRVSNPGDRVTFAVIGDYGLASPEEAAVAKLVRGWSPELVITTGDNNYPDGGAATIDENIGQYYHPFIAPYRGKYGEGADRNRFFPALGNHDWRTWNLAPYLDYFDLPGNERYYTFTWGPVQFFAVDSDRQEPDGNGPDSKQAKWLERALAEADAPWNVVYLHHPPYSSGDHGSQPSSQWPYHAWGADAVIAGHDHHYERIENSEGLFFVNGLGGNPSRYPLRDPLPGSKSRYNSANGAMRVEATATEIMFTFETSNGDVIDRKKLSRETAVHADGVPAFDDWED
jgi:hypothetical protein